jgi:hypothetical protein
MKIKYYILILVSFIVLGSCEQFLEVELPGQEPRMVLNALLEPTDTLKVFLTKSKGVLEGGNFFDEGFDLVEGADVYLKDQEGQIFPFGYIKRGRTWEIEAFYYLANHNLVEGKSYEIFAEKEGFSTINSKQEIPKKVNIKSIDMINLGPDDSYGGHNLFEVILKFEDPLGRNFYEISGEIFGSGYQIIEGDTIPFNTYSSLNPRPVNPIYQKDFLMRNVLLFNDVILNGPESEIVFRTNFPRDVDIEITINFSHVTESYYRYYNSADLQRYNQGDFLSQPVLVYNNISNGMGIFKSRNTVRRVIEMRVGE